MTIDKKLFIGCGASLLITLTFMASSLWSISLLANQVKTTVDREAMKIDYVGALLRDTTDMDASQRSTAWRASMKDPDGVKKNAEEFDVAYQKAAADLHDVERLLQSDEEKSAFQLTTSLVNAWRAGFLQFQQGCAQSFDPAKINKCVEDDLIPLMDHSDSSCEALTAIERSFMDQAKAEAAKRSAHAQWTAGAFFIPCALVGLLLFLTIVNISSSLRRNAEDLSAGAEEVASAAKQIATTSMALAKETTQQAAMIEETSASSEEIRSMALKNSENGSKANRVVAEAAQRSEQANAAVDQCVEAMNDISKSSSDIANTLKVIDNIAFQTNILALNAAVEAARAGEAGAGFAVVADEVRSLAQRCSKASQEISALLDQSVTSVEAGRVKIGTLVGSGAMVTESFKKMQVLVEEIVAGSVEQVRGVEHVGTAVHSIEAGTQRTAANAEESAAAAEELTAQSAQLRDVASNLHRMVGGGDKHGHAKQLFGGGLVTGPAGMQRA